jgi:hypothetical protein
MKTTFLLVAALIPSFFVLTAHAQFGSGIVFDPTQSAHAIEQIKQSVSLYTTTVQTAQNVIAAYNLARHMASLPQLYISAYSNLGRQLWTPYPVAANTYGNSIPWMVAAATGYGAQNAYQAASIPHTTQISGYSSLSPAGQQAVAAEGATVDLSDAVDASNLQTLGIIRSAAVQRESDISNLESATHSEDLSQQTEMAALQRLNQAMLIQLRTQQEQNQILSAQALQQMVDQKQQQDNLKMLFQAADGYEQNYDSAITTSSSSVADAYHH